MAFGIAATLSAPVVWVRVAIVVGATLAACGRESPDLVERPESPPEQAAGTVHEYDYLRDETEHVVLFLRGEAPLDPALLADSVALRISPEGGGQESRASKQQLQARTEWRIGSRSLVPPVDLTHLTIAPGLHFDCVAVPLESRAPDLASRPHVGVRLAASEDATCLQTWNATFVFDDDARSPALIAVIYDQWEW